MPSTEKKLAHALGNRRSESSGQDRWQFVAESTRRDQILIPGRHGLFFGEFWSPFGPPREAYVQQIVAREAHVAKIAQTAPSSAVAAQAKNLVDLFAPIRGLFEDGELDFSRNLSTGRPVDLA